MSKAFGEQNPTQGEDAVSWQTWSNGAGGIPSVVGDIDWGKLSLQLSGAEGRSAVYDLGSAKTRKFTLTENRYGTGAESAVIEIRGDSSSFSQDSNSPVWEIYSAPVWHSYRYVQVRARTATFYFVDIVNGNDGWAGTFAAPFQHIATANALVTPGDIVYLRGGTYTESILPAYSGISGSPITYKNYAGETVLIWTVDKGANLDGKSYITIDGLQIKRCYTSWVSMRTSTGLAGGTPSTYNVVANCYFEECHGWGGIYMKYGANYNWVHDNIIIGRMIQDSSPDAWTGPNDGIYSFNNSYNLIEDNIIVYCTHCCINVQHWVGTSTKNVIRNNTMTTIWHHCLNIYENADGNLVEGNKCFDAGIDHLNIPCNPHVDGSADEGNGNPADAAFADDDHAGIEVGGQHNIFRYNITAGCGSGYTLNGVDLSGDSGNQVICDNNRFYNNTLYGNRNGVKISSNPVVEYNYWKNNIFYNNEVGRTANTYSEIRTTIDDAVPPDIYNFYFCNIIKNTSYTDTVRNDADGMCTVAWLEANRATWFGSNLVSDPSFVDAPNDNFNLNDGSPAIGAGTSLTLASGGATGTALVVDDSRWFCDGYGVVDADWIKIGASAAVQISSINHATNTITLTASRTWSDNDPVYLYKNSSGTVVLLGSVPCLGAIERAA